MTVQVKLPGASLACKTWSTINWCTVEKHVRRLQIRIAKATREGKQGKAKALQWILTHSFYPKLLAIRRVSQSKGSKTPGVDGEIWNSDKKKRSAVERLKRRGYKPQTLRRIYIPKNNGKQRPLSIPCLVDRAQQALHLLGLEPISETLVDKNAYGFRPKRSCADAIEQCFKTLCRKSSAKFCMEGDIRSCFDKIGHQWLLQNITMDKQVLGKWLTSGYMDKGVFYHTEEGVPQGGVISPTIMLLTLKGLEKTAKEAAPKRLDKVNTIAYADDFIITGSSKEILEDKVKPAVRKFLAVRGLELSEEKTKITHIADGFDFLGFNIRKYNGKLLIKPAKQNVLKFIQNIKGIIKKNAATSAGTLIEVLSPKLRGWGNYYKHVVSNRTFGYVDSQIFEALYRWAKRRHPNKSKTWVVKKYYHMGNANDWTFQGRVKLIEGGSKHLQLVKLDQIPIRRHIKVKMDANPYDPEYADYFRKRSEKKGRNTWTEPTKTAL